MAEAKKHARRFALLDAAGTHKLTTEEIRPIVTRVLQRAQSTPRSSQPRVIS